MDAGAVAQLDAAQAELEAGNAALLQGAPFLVEMLALQAAAPGMGAVSTPKPPKVPCVCIMRHSDTLCASSNILGFLQARVCIKSTCCRQRRVQIDMIAEVQMQMLMRPLALGRTDTGCWAACCRESPRAPIQCSLVARLLLDMTACACRCGARRR